MPAARVLITEDPFVDQPLPDHSWRWISRGIWPCSWVSHPEPGKAPLVTAYRLKFTVKRTATVRIHVSADERYELFLDGERIGRGSERGDLEHWYYESYDLSLKPGQHRLVARVWSMGDQAPFAQHSLRPGFLLAATGKALEQLSTGIAAWEVKVLNGYAYTPCGPAFGTGSNLIVDGAAFDWDYENGAGKGWVKAVSGPQDQAGDGPRRNEYPPTRLLRPATLPAMLEQPRQAGQLRHLSTPSADDLSKVALLPQDHLGTKAAGWQAWLDGAAPLSIPPRSAFRAIIDIGDYVCAYPELLCSNGRGSEVRLLWAESLFLKPGEGAKGNRDEVDGKYFNGFGDSFKPHGLNRCFNTLWWQAGRYLELVVRTGDEALTLTSLRLLETRYPLEMQSRFKSDDARLEAFTPIGLRGLQMCAHETYMDCPYYEQLMYAGDTRLECLVTYALTCDDRLPRKAVAMYDYSRLGSGLTQSRYPSRVTQCIPPFSLWWVGMVYDYALWRGDPNFIKSRMSGVRAVLDAFHATLDSQGLVHGPEGWNYMDWVPTWPAGMPQDGEFGVSGLINWQLVYTLERAAQLEAWLGEKEMATRDRRLASSLAKRLVDKFWVKKRGLFADDLKHSIFSEHSQCLALLSGHLPKPLKKPLKQGLLSDPGLDRTTIYFSHYLFEAYAELGQVDALLKRLELWFEHGKLGMKTTLEAPEPSRSDCHAWGSHPLYHYFATLLGLRPGGLGFETVEIRPQLGPLRSARGELVHPKGMIKIELKRTGKRIEADIHLPKGLSGRFTYGGKHKDLRPGGQKFRI